MSVGPPTGHLAQVIWPQRSKWHQKHTSVWSSFGGSVHPTTKRQLPRSESRLSPVPVHLPASRHQSPLHSFIHQPWTQFLQSIPSSLTDLPVTPSSITPRPSPPYHSTLSPVTRSFLWTFNPFLSHHVILALLHAVNQSKSTSPQAWSLCHRTPL